MSYEVVEIQQTPNPNALKFILDRVVTQAPRSYLSAGEAEGDGLAEQLFAVTGVASVLLLDDFVTINKTPEVAWGKIRSRVKEILKKNE